MRRRQAIWWLAAVTVIGTVGCGNRTKVSDLGLDAAILPQAELLVRVDAKAMQAAPISKDIKPLQAAMQSGLTEEDWQKIELALGITREDIVNVAGSADFDPLMEAAPGAEPDFKRLPLVMGLELAKAVPPKRLATALRAQAFAEKSGATIEPFKHNGLDAVRVSGDLSDKEAGAETFVIGFAPSNKLLFVGSELGVTMALDRLRTGAGDEVPNPVFAQAEAALPSHQMLVLFAPSAEMRQKYEAFIGEAQANLPDDAARQAQIKELENRIAEMRKGAAGPGAMMAGQMDQMLKMQQAQVTWLENQPQVVDAADEIQAIALGADASETVTYTLSVLFAEAQPATDVVEFVQEESQLLIPDQPAPDASELAKLRPSFATEGSVAKVSVTLNKAQLEELMTMSNQMKQGSGMPGMPGAGGPPMPPGGPPMPPGGPPMPSAPEPPAPETET